MAVLLSFAKNVMVKLPSCWKGIKMRELMSEVVKCRVTPSEKRRIQTEAKKRGLNESDYLRTQLMKEKSYTIKDIREVEKIIRYEINKIGVNINQIAKKYNEYRLTGASDELLARLQEVSNLQKKIEDMLKE